MPSSLDVQIVWHGATWRQFMPPSPAPPMITTDREGRTVPGRVLALLSGGPRTAAQLRRACPDIPYGIMATTLNRLLRAGRIQKTHKLADGPCIRAWAYGRVDGPRVAD
mgnify:CR=1 FL=1